VQQKVSPPWDPANEIINTALLLPPHILSLMPLAQTTWDKTEVRFQSMWNNSRQQFTLQRSHLTRTRKDVAWEIQGNQCPIHYLETHRRESDANRLIRYRKSSVPPSQGTNYRICWTGKDKGKATIQDSGKSRGRQKDLNRVSQRTRSTQRNRKRKQLESSHPKAPRQNSS
jgi:hypothetical protein